MEFLPMTLDHRGISLRYHSPEVYLMGSSYHKLHSFTTRVLNLLGFEM